MLQTEYDKKTTDSSSTTRVSASAHPAPDHEDVAGGEMTLRELQAACEDLANDHPELLDEEVYMTSDYGDFGHNEQCIRIQCLVHTLVSNGPHAQAYSQQRLEVVHPGPEHDEGFDPDDMPPDMRPGLVLGYKPEWEYCDLTGLLH